MDDAVEGRILDLLYRGAADPASLTQALELLAETFSCQSAAFVAFDIHEPGGWMTMSTGQFAEPAVLQRYAEYAALDPAPGFFASLAAGRASTTDRLMPSEMRARSQFANEFYHPLGLVETLGGNLFFERGRSALIGLHRGNERGAFTDSDIAAVERLTPHLRRILQLRRQFSGLLARNAVFEAMLDRLPSGAVLVGQDGTALFVNRTMDIIARRGNGFLLGASGLPAPTHADARRRFQRLLADVMCGGPGGALAVPSIGSDGAYNVLVARAPGDVIDAQGRHAALVIVHDPASRTMTPPAVLRQVLGLPEGAAQLALALSGDDDLKSFAERQGITIHTARFHLRTALARTGTRTQSELVRLVVRMLRDFSLAEDAGS
jgi:DNA-binding CsgD family transcriptional regulator